MGVNLSVFSRTGCASMLARSTNGANQTILPPFGMMYTLKHSLSIEVISNILLFTIWMSGKRAVRRRQKTLHYEAYRLYRPDHAAQLRKWGQRRRPISPLRMPKTWK